MFKYFEGVEEFIKQRREEICDRKKIYVEEVFYFLVFFVFVFLVFSETTLSLILYCKDHTAI